MLFYAKHCKQNEELRVTEKQLLQSGTSVAANFRAFMRGRPKAEKFSKLCIIVEETNETQFWVELIEKANLLYKSLYSTIKDEANELIKIFTATKYKIKKIAISACCLPLAACSYSINPPPRIRPSL